jgi:hypothetical protein
MPAVPAGTATPDAERAGAVREYHYVVDREGRMFHDGTEIVDVATLRFFLLAMRRAEDGRHLVLCQGERNWFSAEDTPFVVQRLAIGGRGGEQGGDPARTAAGGGHPSGSAVPSIELILAGDYRERLDPATLESEDGKVFCRMRKGAVRARFGRVAVQQLAPFLVEAAGQVGLRLAGVVYPIKLVTHGGV